MLVDLRNVTVGANGALQYTSLSGTPAIVLGSSTYLQTFSENFRRLINVTPFGPSDWIAHTPWNGDFGDAAFTDPSPGFPFAYTPNGLQIIAKKDSNGQWRGGLLSSRDPQGRGFAQALGYFECRMKMPSGPGVWPAFWLYALDDPNLKAEIDVVEYYGQFPTSYVSTAQLWPKSSAYQHSYSQKIINTTGDLSAAFHTYGVEITTANIVFYFDRQPVFTTIAQPPMLQPLSILLNLTLGGGWPIDQTPNPSALQVDYVKVFRKLT